VSDGPEVALNWLFPDLNFFDSAQCLMVRRWRLIGHFPILYNPLLPERVVKRAPTRRPYPLIHQRTYAKRGFWFRVYLALWPVE
jgi:hypothetical protein